MNANPKKLIYGIVGVLLGIFLIVASFKMFEDVDAGEVLIVQDAIDGELHVYSTAGWKWQLFGKVEHYRKSNQFWFNAPSDSSETDKSIPIQWADGALSRLSGSIRYDLPLDEKSMMKIHSIFGSQKALEHQLIKTNLEKAVYMTGPLVTAKESYAEKKNNLIFYVEDQISRGVYKTTSMEVVTTDDLTGAEKTVTKVEVLTEPGTSIPLRQEKSPISEYALRMYNISINRIYYDKSTEEQIRTQQKAIMNVQTA